MRPSPAVLALTLLALAAPLGAQVPEATLASAQTLKALSIEELMQIDVTSANRRAEPAGDVAAAISVITSEDIRRSGVTTIADALALADGIEVARFNNGTWAITPRGFNQNAANKLLVLVDGRTEYSPLFTGVFWNTLDYVLADIDRIEVIRGPGAVLWGANAVNGVVNIITRSARDTQGGYATIAAGSQDPAIVEARYGGTLAGGPAWRAYGKFADRDAQALASGASAGDGIRRGQGGFRLDGGSPTTRNWLVKGDLFHSDDSFSDRPNGAFTNGSLQARWSSPLPDGSRVTVQSYVRHEFRQVPLQLTHHVNTVDLDAQHAWRSGPHDVVWGGGFRVNMDGTVAGSFHFDPPTRTYRVGNVFAQDEYTVIPGRLFATLGAKWEHNAFSGGEFQPNLRGRVLLPRHQMAWAAVARAVRRPTRFEDDLVIPAPSGVTLITGSDDFRAESLKSLEGGYRVQPLPSLSVDVSVFRNVIHGLRSQEAPIGGGIPITIGNTLIGHAQGVETAVNLQPLRRWRTHVSYTWLETSVERASGSRDISGGVNEANDPPQWFGLRSSLDLPHDVALDLMLRSVAALPNPVVPAYSELSLRAGWTPKPGVDVWVAGQDLLHDHHPEFGPVLPTRVEYERTFRAGLALRF